MSELAIVLMSLAAGIIAGVIVAVALSRINNLDGDGPEIVDCGHEPIGDIVDVRRMRGNYED